MRKIEIFLLSLTLLLLAFFGARAHAETRMEVIENLQAWKQETLTRSDLEPREKDLRLELINRLVFQTERKYKEGPLKNFLLITLENMAETDDLASNQSFGSNSDFLLNLQDSLKTLLEQNESPLKFIQDFTNFSSVANPKTPDEFAETRSYYDGKNLQSAHTMEVDEAADYAEKKEIEASTLRDLEMQFYNRNLVEEFQPTPKGPY